MATRTYYCPDCDGRGEFLVNPTNDPQCDSYVLCHCDGGFIQSDDPDCGLRPYTPSRRRWTGLRHPAGRDWLEVMAQRRPAAAAQKRQFPRTDLSYTEYGFARLCAMRPSARLVQCDMLALASRCVTTVEQAHEALKAAA
jgi:hypothetical protein